MLKLVLDSDSGSLAARLLAWFAESSTDPFTSDTLLVNDFGTGTWLEQHLARATGISANLKIDLPGRFLWRVVESAVSGSTTRSPFDPMLTRWMIWSILEHAPDDDQLQVLTARWREAPDSQKMLLATQLGGLFERYLAYRRDWLNLWAHGRAIDSAQRVQSLGGQALLVHQPWQRWLWRELLHKMTGVSTQHPFDSFREKMAAGSFTLEPASAKTLSLESLTGRVALYGVIDLSPDQLDLLSMLASKVDITWFAPDPSQGFWEDLVSPAEAAKIASSDPESAWLYTSEPIILGEWGRQHRDFLARLRALETAGVVLVDDQQLRMRDEPVVANRLQALQAALFTLSDMSWSYERDPDEYDASLEVHGAHGLMRQVEVAHDRVLAAFDQIPDLRADQVVVYCADFDACAPLIETVFSQLAKHPLPIRLGAIKQITEGPVAACLEFLELAQGPASLASVMDWFDSVLLREACAFSDDDIRGLREILEAAGCMRDDIGEQQSGAKHGWSRGIERIMLGAFVGPLDDPMVGDTMAIGQLTATSANALVFVQDLLESLALFRVSKRQSIAGWVQLIIDWAQDFFGHVPSAHDGLLNLREILASLGQSAAIDGSPIDDTVSLSLFTQALRSQVEAHGVTVRASGSITVAPLGAFRGVSYRVCILLGMDEGRWPSRQTRLEYDLQLALPRFGDRSPGSEARGVFLDALRDTRERAVMLFSSRDARDDSARNPCRPLRELLDYVATRERDLGLEDQQVFGLIEHRLQPFSPARFADDAPVPSYATFWHEAALQLQSSDREKTLDQSLGLHAHVEPPAQFHLSLSELLAAYLQPAREYLRAGAAMRLPFNEDQLAWVEPLDIDALDRRSNRALLEMAGENARAEHSRHFIKQRLYARPEVPDGIVGQLLADKILLSAEHAHQLDQQVLATLGVVPGSEPRYLDINLSLADEDGSSIGLTERIGPVYAVPGGGWVQLLPSVEKCTMKAVFDVWCRHLVWLAQPGECSGQLQTWCQTADAKGSDRPASIGLNHELPAQWREHAVQHLEKMLTHRQQVRREASVFFPSTVQEWLSKSSSLSAQADNKAWSAAAMRYLPGGGGFAVQPETQWQWNKALWRDTPPPLDVVLSSGLALYGPVWLLCTGQTDALLEQNHGE